ncbi:MAG: hypothetical protein MZV49_06250 [Rhodopseudomonas palustris]|nr:hypothetical protein [Rhodopseudomonas palustris]
MELVEGQPLVEARSRPDGVGPATASSRIAVPLADAVARRPRPRASSTATSSPQNIMIDAGGHA